MLYVYIQGASRCEEWATCTWTWLLFERTHGTIPTQWIHACLSVSWKLRFVVHTKWWRSCPVRNRTRGFSPFGSYPPPFLRQWSQRTKPHGSGKSLNNLQVTPWGEEFLWISKLLFWSPLFLQRFCLKFACMFSGWWRLRAEVVDVSTNFQHFVYNARLRAHLTRWWG